MKKILSLFFVVAFVITSFSLSVFAERSSPVSLSPVEWNSLSTDYFPFVYSSDESWDWLRDYIGRTDSCQDGYLYTKKWETGEITQLLNEKVKVVRESLSYVFCITENNAFLRVNYVGGRDVQLIYQAVDSEITLLSSNRNIYLFVEGNHVIKYDALTQTLSPAAVCDRITSVYPLSDTTFTWENEGGERFIHDISANTDQLILSDAEYDNLFLASDTSNEESADLNASSSLPLHPSYPNGSYFTKNGGPCDHHPDCSYTGDCNCKPYYGSIQCAGFAQFMYDYYSHKTGFVRASGDNITPIGNLTSYAAVQAFLNQLTPGAYIRLSRIANDTGVGSHSIVFLSQSGSTFRTYECNVNNTCNVVVRDNVYSYFTNGYKCIVNASSHTYTGGYAKYSASQHKSFCKSSGCNGYRFDVHLAKNPGANATCYQCGYVGAIYAGQLD